MSIICIPSSSLSSPSAVSVSFVPILIKEVSVISSDATTELSFRICAIFSSDKNIVAINLPALDSIAELTNRFLAVFDGPNSRIYITPSNPSTITNNAVKILNAILFISLLLLLFLLFFIFLL